MKFLIAMMIRFVFLKFDPFGVINYEPTCMHHCFLVFLQWVWFFKNEKHDENRFWVNRKDVIELKAKTDTLTNLKNKAIRNCIQCFGVVNAAKQLNGCDCRPMTLVNSKLFLDLITIAETEINADFIKKN